MPKINELKCELLFKRQDLSASDYFRFPNLKERQRGKIFANKEVVEYAVDYYFEELQVSYIKYSIETIEHRWGKCIKLKGDYVEK